MVSVLRTGGGVARRRIAALALLSVVAFPFQAVWAQEQTPDKAATMAEFVRNNPSCLDFTDGCSICTVSHGEITCSAPRIQCQVKELSCTRW